MILQYNFTGVTPTVLWPIALDTMTLLEQHF